MKANAQTKNGGPDERRYLCLYRPCKMSVTYVLSFSLCVHHPKSYRAKGTAAIKKNARALHQAKVSFFSWVFCLLLACGWLCYISVGKREERRGNKQDWKRAKATQYLGGPY